MGRIADLVESQRARRGPQCAAGVALETYSKTERGEWADVLANPGIRHTEIATALKADDHNVSADSVSRHRRGECACGSNC